MLSLWLFASTDTPKVKNKKKYRATAGIKLAVTPAPVHLEQTPDKNENDRKRAERGDT